jgi:hypothetical protein
MLLLAEEKALLLGAGLKEACLGSPEERGEPPPIELLLAKGVAGAGGVCFGLAGGLSPGASGISSVTSAGSSMVRYSSKLQSGGSTTGAFCHVAATSDPLASYTCRA